MKTNMHHQENVLDKFLKYFAMVMAIGYILFGLFLIATADEALVIPKIHVMALSIIFTGYGFYRGIRVYQKYYKQKYEG